MAFGAQQLRLLVCLCITCVGCGKDSAPPASPANSGGGGSAGQTSVGGSSSSGSSSAGQAGMGAAGMPTRPISEWPVDAGTKDGPFEWIGVIGTGQSLHVGCQSEAISTTSPFKNVMLQDEGPDPKYPLDGAATAQWSPVPLLEPIRFHVAGYAADDSGYPNNICITDGKYGETPHSGFANTLSKLWADRGKGDYVTAHTVSARGSACLSQISKADVLARTYASGIAEARVYKKLADAAGKTYGVAAVLLTHGECDTQQENKMYGEQLYQLWSDYNADIKEITGQTRDVVLIATQQSSLPWGLNGTNTQLWRAGNEHPGKIICAGPKYAYGSYGVHFLTGSAYERLGEKYAEVFDYVVNREAPWKPLGPSSAVRAGAVITVTFDVPHPPMVWDSHLAPPHTTAHTGWAPGKGFEAFDAAGAELAIASAEIRDNDVVLTLAAEPAGPVTIAYALTQDVDGWIGGSDLGMHGLLRDSNDFVGYAQEDIEVTVTKDSPLITVAEGGFVRRAALDLVSGPSIADDTVVKELTPKQITLSSPWTGDSGTATLSFHHNHYNYAVHFSLTTN